MTWLKDKTARVIALIGFVLLFIALFHIEMVGEMFNHIEETKK